MNKDLESDSLREADAVIEGMKARGVFPVWEIVSGELSRLVQNDQFGQLMVKLGDENTPGVEKEEIMNDPLFVFLREIINAKTYLEKEEIGYKADYKSVLQKILADLRKQENHVRFDREIMQNLHAEHYHTHEIPILEAALTALSKT